MSETKMVKAVCKKNGMSFGLKVKRYSSHDCHILSHAYINDIQMSQTKGAAKQ